MKVGTRESGMTRRIAAAFLLCGLAALLGGCGGGGGGSNGGGGGGNNGFAIITGQVLLLSTNSTPTTTTTVSSGGITTTASASDGTFTLSNVPTSAKTLTIDVAATSTVTATTGNNHLVRTLSIALTANQTAALGAVYVGATTANGTPDYTAVVTGRVVTNGTAGTQGVGNATVTIAGVQVKTSANAATLGNFTINGLPVGLGSEIGVLIGSVQAPGFSSRDLITTDTGGLSFATGLVSGANNIGAVTILQPTGSTPAPPYTITGQVTVSGTGRPSQSVQLLQNGTLVGNVTTDANGNYFFWVVAGTYTVQAITTSGSSRTQTVSVTLATLDNPVTAPTINF